MSGTSLYQIHYLESVVKEDIPQLSTTAKKLIRKAIEERLIPSFPTLLQQVGEGSIS